MRKQFTALLIFAISWSAMAADASEALYVVSSERFLAEDGKLLTMTLRETERTQDFSLVDVDYVAGGNAASLFLARGFCGLLAARGRELAVAEQVAEKPVQFRITFPTTAKIQDQPGPPRMVLSKAECSRILAPRE